MIDTIVNSFNIWTDAQGVKSRGRVKSVDNIKLVGIQKLRELVLDLAISGKLGTNDSKDIPVSKILMNISEQRNELEEKKIIRKKKKLNPISENEKFTELPQGWEFVRLNDIGDWGAGATPSRRNPSFYNGDIPWFKSGELSADFISESEEKITQLALEKTSLRYNQVGDVLIAMYGATIGKTSILKVRGTTNQAVCACTPFDGIYNVYLLTLLKAYKQRFTKKGAGGAQPNISREKIINTVIVLPPLEEQKRIVTKVDELMALCDKLVQERETNLKTHQILVKTILDSLTQAKDSDKLQIAWERMSTHFDTLFCTEDSIEQLKQTILQLGIMGKLVKQDTNDESSKILLENIAKERTRLIKGKLIRNQKPLPSLNEEDLPFQIPNDWSWCRLQDLVTLLGDGIHGTPNYSTNDEYYFVNGNNLSDGVIEIKPNTKTVSQTEFVKHKRILNERTVLVSINGTIGNTAFYNNEKVILGKSACYFNLFEGLNKEYIRQLIKSKYFLEYAYDAATGTTIKNVSLKAMRSLLVPLPPINEQNRIVEKLNELVTTCNSISEKIKKSEDLKVILSNTIIEKSIA